MSPEQQREASKRILAKEPMTEYELRRQRFLEMKPEDYPQNRMCPECGMEFPKSEINEHADHMATHAPNHAQWVEAHRRIEDGKERAKRQTISA